MNNRLAFLPKTEMRRSREMYLRPVMTAALLHLLLSFSLLSTAAQPASPTLPPSPAPTNCSNELVTFSMCLSYISSYPNNLTITPSSQCCNDVASAVTSGTAVCLCYLIRQPLMLGFPLNSTRLLSVATLCRVKDRENKTGFSLDSLCSGSPMLPPLLSITGPDDQSENTSGGKVPDGPSKEKSGPVNPPPPSTSLEGTNDTEAPASVKEPADDYFDFKSQHVSAANVGTQSLSTTIGRCSSEWRCFIPQIMILALHLSTYL